MRLKGCPVFITRFSVCDNVPTTDQGVRRHRPPRAIRSSSFIHAFHVVGVSFLRCAAAAGSDLTGVLPMYGCRRGYPSAADTDRRLLCWKRKFLPASQQSETRVRFLFAVLNCWGSFRLLLEITLALGITLCCTSAREARQTAFGGDSFQSQVVCACYGRPEAT